MIELLLGSGIIDWVISAVVAVVAALAYGKYQKRKGKREVLREIQEDDHEHAADIRDRVDRDLDKRVREVDDAGIGYRD